MDSCATPQALGGWGGGGGGGCGGEERRTDEMREAEVPESKAKQSREDRTETEADTWTEACAGACAETENDKAERSKVNG